MRLFLEYRLWYQRVDALVTIDELSNVKIGCDARKHVSVVPAQVFLAGKKVYCLAHRHLRCLGQIFVNTHSDEVRWRFGARPAEMHIFADNQLKRADQ